MASGRFEFIHLDQFARDADAEVGETGCPEGGRGGVRGGLRAGAAFGGEGVEGHYAAAAVA